MRAIVDTFDIVLYTGFLRQTYLTGRERKRGKGRKRGR